MYLCLQLVLICFYLHVSAICEKSFYPLTVQKHIKTTICHSPDGKNRTTFSFVCVRVCALVWKKTNSPGGLSKLLPR